MTTTAFRSNGRRSSITTPEDDHSTNLSRRSRSLSRHFGPSLEIDEHDTPRGKFVNKVRGSGILNISLDDLADEFFRFTAEEFEGDVNRRVIGGRFMEETESSRQRGRSVSRHRSDSFNSGNSKHRRSVSVSRSLRSELKADESSEVKPMSKNRASSSSIGLQKPSFHKQASEGNTLGRSISQKDFLQLQDCYSSHSSSLTDDEAHDACSNIDRVDRDGGRFKNYENKSKEVRKLAEELMELEKSEKRKQELLAELAIEEKRGQKLGKIVRHLLSSPSRSSTQRGSDSEKISKYLDEEAERYFEDFLSNVEDTDLSSFDSEKSDAGSTNKVSESVNNDAARMRTDLLRAAALTAETDDAIFPWLQWETSNCSSPSSCKTKTAIMQKSAGSSSEGNESLCDMNEYLQLQCSEEDLLLEMWEQRQRIASGSLLMC